MINIILILGILCTFTQGLFIERKDTKTTFICGMAFTLMLVILININR